MARALISACEQSLTKAFERLGLLRYARGVYTKSDDNVIWRGVWITFNSRHGIVVTQPNVGVFCPTAERLVSEGLNAIYSRETDESYFGKLRGPVLTRPLYSLVRATTDESRLPPEYHVANVAQIDEVTSLIQDDFARAGRHFLDPIIALSDLKDQLMKDGATGSRMYAITVTYLMNGQITSNEIDEIIGVQPNPMSRKFAEYFRVKFADAGA